MMMNMMKELPKIKEDQRTRMKDMLRQRERELDMRMNRSVSGLKDAIAQRWEKAWRPMREAGAEMYKDVGESLDEAWQTVLGADTTPSMDITQQERRQILQGGAPSAAATTAMQQGLGQRRLQVKTGAIERFRRGGFGALFGGDTDAADTRGEALRHLGMGTDLGQQAGAGDYDLGGGYTARVGATNEALQRTQRLAASNFTLAGLGYSSGPDNQKHVSTIRDSMVKAAQTDKGRSLLMKLNRGEISKGQFREQMLSVVRESGGRKVEEAIQSLREKRAGGAGAENVDAMELMAVAAGDEKGRGDILGFKEATVEYVGEELGVMPTTRKELAKLEDKAASQAASLLTKAVEDTKSLAKYAAGTPLAQQYEAVGEVDEDEVKKALRGGRKWSKDLRKWLSSGAPDAKGGDEKNEFLKAALGIGRAKDPEAEKLLATLQITKGSGLVEKLGGLARDISGFREAEVHFEAAAERADVAESEEMFAERATATLAPAQAKKYKEILELYKSEDTAQQQRAAEMSQELAGEVSAGQMQALASAGGVGRMIAGMGRTAQLLQAPQRGLMTAGRFAQAKRKISAQFGFDVFGSMSEEQQEEIEKMVKSDDGLTREELESIQKKVRETAKDVGPQKVMRELADQSERIAKLMDQAAKSTGQWISSANEAFAEHGIKLKPTDEDSADPEDRKAEKKGGSSWKFWE
jgi:hypothetical protein